jgi:hypothetical protein
MAFARPGLSVGLFVLRNWTFKWGLAWSACSTMLRSFTRFFRRPAAPSERVSFTRNAVIECHVLANPVDRDRVLAPDPASQFVTSRGGLAGVRPIFKFLQT